MSDLRACAAHCITVCEDGLGYHPEYRKAMYVMEKLARAVLSSLDVPADVLDAMERRKEYDAEMRDGKGRDTYHGTPHLWSTDNATIARHFIANPIRLDVPDREQLLRDVETVQSAVLYLHNAAIHLRKSGNTYYADILDDRKSNLHESIERLAAHTRRTLKGEK